MKFNRSLPLTLALAFLASCCSSNLVRVPDPAVFRDGTTAVVAMDHTAKSDHLAQSGKLKIERAFQEADVTIADLSAVETLKRLISDTEAYKDPERLRQTLDVHDIDHLIILDINEFKLSRREIPKESAKQRKTREQLGLPPDNRKWNVSVNFTLRGVDAHSSEGVLWGEVSKTFPVADEAGAAQFANSTLESLASSLRKSLQPQ